MVKSWAKPAPKLHVSSYGLRSQTVNNAHLSLSLLSSRERK